MIPPGNRGRARAAGIAICGEQCGGIDLKPACRIGSTVPCRVGAYDPFARRAKNAADFDIARVGALQQIEQKLA